MPPGRFNLCRTGDSESVSRRLKNSLRYTNGYRVLRRFALWLPIFEAGASWLVICENAAGLSLEGLFVTKSQ